MPTFSAFSSYTNAEKKIKPRVMLWLKMDVFLREEDITLEVVLMNDGSEDETIKIVNHEINTGLYK